MTTFSQNCSCYTFIDYQTHIQQGAICTIYNFCMCT